MLRHSLLMGVTTIVRLLTAVVLFIFLARLWGPSEFGLFMYWVAVTGIITILLDYGFVPKVLREVGKAPSSAHIVVSEIVVAKLVIAFIVILITAILSIIIDIPKLDLLLMWPLLVSSILFSFGEFFCAPFRAVNQYSTEAKVVIVSNILHFIIVLSLAYIGIGIVGIAVAFVFTRLMYVLIIIYSYKRTVGLFRLPKNSIGVAFSQLNSGKMYALDLGLANLYSQLDVVLIKIYLGSYWVGIYQSGLKIAQGYLSLVQVLNSVFMPKLAKCEHDGIVASKLFNQLFLQSILMGLTGYIGFKYVLPEIIVLGLGAQYAQVIFILPYLGLMILVRYIASGLGIALAAFGLQKSRVVSTVFALVIFLILTCIFVPEYKLQGLVCAFILSNIFIILYYLYKILFGKKVVEFNNKNIVLSFFSIILLVVDFISY